MSSVKNSEKFSVMELEFIYNMVLGLKGPKAAIKAGYSAKGADSQASRLLNRVKISREIRRLIEQKFAHEIMGPKETLAILTRIANVNISDIFNDDGTMKKLSEIPEEAKTAICAIEKSHKFGDKYKLESKIAAATLIGRFHKLFVDRVEVVEKGLGSRMQRAEDRARERAAKKDKADEKL